MRDKVLSLNERKFAIDCIAAGYRVDSRTLTESRKVDVKLGPSWGFAEVKFGGTHAIATTTVEAVKPPSDRPNEGNLSVSIELSPTSSETSARESLAQQRQQQQQQQFLETKNAIDGFLRESRCVDTEALCILSGIKVWSVRISIDVVHDEGNCMDCSMMCAMASLLHARKPDVSVSGHEVRIFSMDEREPVPLPVHHIPLSVSFVVISKLNNNATNENDKSNNIPSNDSEISVIDPIRVEETAANGGVSFAFNSQGEVCGVYKAGGVPLLPRTFAECATIAVQRVIELTQILKTSMKEAAEDQPMATMRPMLVNAEPTAVIRTEVLEIREDSDEEDVKAKDSNNDESMKNVTMSTWNAMKLPDEAPPPLQETKGRESTKKNKRAEVDEDELIDETVQGSFRQKNNMSQNHRMERENDEGIEEGELYEDNVGMQIDRKMDLSVDVKAVLQGDDDDDDDNDDDDDDDSSDDDLTGAILSKKKRR